MVIGKLILSYIYLEMAESQAYDIIFQTILEITINLNEHVISKYQRIAISTKELLFNIN